MIGDISTLNPIFRLKVELILRDLRVIGWQPVIASGMRTNAQQDALYATGRRGLQEVNAMRLRTGLPPVTAAENNPVTNAKGGESLHNLGRAELIPAGRKAVDEVHCSAVDIVDRRYNWSGPAANEGFQFWKDLGRAAQKYGCEWGGNWKKKDVAHVQLRFVETAPITTVAV